MYISSTVFVGILVPLLMPLVVRLLRQKQADTSKRIILFSFFLLLYYCIPMIRINQQNQSVISIIQNGSISFGLMFLGYIISFLFLLKKDPNYDSASAVIYFISWIFCWIGFYRYIPRGPAPNFFTMSLILLPMVNALFYLSLIYATVPADADRNRTGIWLRLYELGTNRELIRILARELNLELHEGDILRKSSAKGEIDGFSIEVTRANYKNTTRFVSYDYWVTQATVFVKNGAFPKAAIAGQNVKLIKSLLTMKKFVEANFDNFTIITSKDHKDFYIKLLAKTEYAQELNSILKRKSVFDPFGSFLVFEHDCISFNQPFPSKAISGYLKDLKNAIKLMISFGTLSGTLLRDVSL